MKNLELKIGSLVYIKYSETKSVYDIICNLNYYKDYDGIMRYNYYTRCLYPNHPIHIKSLDITVIQ